MNSTPAPSSAAATSTDIVDDAQSDEGTSKTKRWSCTDFKIPFECQIMLLMLIPIIFLCIVAGTAMSQTLSEIRLISKHEETYLMALECQGALENELQLSSGYLTGTSASYGQNRETTLSALQDGMQRTRSVCLVARVLARSSPYVSVRNVFREETMINLHKEYLVVRYRVTHRQVTASEARAVYAKYIRSYGRMLVVVSQKALRTAPSLEQVRVSGDARRVVDLVRLLGTEILSNTSSVSTSLQIEFKSAVKLAIALYKELSTIAHGAGKQLITKFMSSHTFINFFMKVGFFVNEDYLYAGNKTSADFFNAGFRVVADVGILNRGMLEYAKAQSELRGEASRQALLLAIAVIVGAVASALIIRAQLISVRQLERSTTKIQELQRAVTAFVPVPFLRLMGATSILHVMTGSATNVGASLLFSDIRNFSIISNKMKSKALFKWLHEYFGNMTTVVEEHNGFIDVFMGDAIFAVFQNIDDAAQCGIGIEAAIDQLSVSIRTRKGRHLVSVGVGIHHAVVSAGMMGSAQRHTPTLISSDVNLASRLEGLTKFYNVRILVSETSYALCQSSLQHRRIGNVTVKGQKKVVSLVEIFQADPLPVKKFKTATLPQFCEALKIREEEGDIERSKQMFQELKNRADKLNVADGVLDLKVEAAGPDDVFFKK